MPKAGPLPIIRQAETDAAIKLKSLLPYSLFGRSLLILMIPIILLQLVVGLVFFQRHYLRVTDQLTEGVALELLYAIDRIEAASDPVEASRRILPISGPLRLQLSIDSGEELMQGSTRRFLDATGGRIIKALDETIPRPLSVDLISDMREAHIGIQTRYGVLEAEIPRNRLTVSNPHQLLVLMLIASLLLSTLSVLFLRNQVRPIRKLAEVAEAFGKGRALPFRPAGAEEVRRAGSAFLAMRTRLERQIEQRTQMLSGVSHDLRTPLTRMKLTVALMEPSDELRDIEYDIDQMERMLAEFLAFAQGDVLEKTSPTDPFELADKVVDSVRRLGRNVVRIDENATPENGLVHLRVGSVQRALQNLLSNAARHGETVQLTVALGQRRVEFKVEDDGPGISAENRSMALSPFMRLDASRNQNTEGNVGLGLSIAMDIARSHGGILELDSSPGLGGLRANLSIPR